MLVVAAFLWGAASDAFLHASQLALAEIAGDDLDLSGSPSQARAPSSPGGKATGLDLPGSPSQARAPSSPGGKATGLDLPGSPSQARAPSSPGGKATGLDATLARTNLLGSIGDLLGPIVLTVAVVTGVGWRPVFAVSAVLMLGYSAVLARQPLPPPRPDGSRPWSVVRAVLADRRVWSLAAAMGLLTTLDEPFVGFLIASFEERSLSAGVATALVGAIVLGSVLGFGVLALRGDSIPGRAAVVGGTATTGASVVLVVAPWPIVLAAAGLVFGAGVALVWVVLQASVFRMRPGQAGTTEAVVSALASFELLVPPLVGITADAVGLAGAMWIYVGLSGALMLVLAGPNLRSVHSWTRASGSRSRP